jgi:uncharacterized protein (TIGR02266 family)
VSEEQPNGPPAPSSRLRRHRRHSIALRVRYSGASGRIEGPVGNISLGGLKISGAISDRIGDRVELTIRLPHVDREVKAEAEVIWVDREPRGDLATVGVRFVAPEPDLNVLLGQILRAGLPK